MNPNVAARQLFTGVLLNNKFKGLIVNEASRKQSPSPNDVACTTEPEFDYGLLDKYLDDVSYDL